MTADSCFATAETIKPTVPAGRPALRRSLFAVLLVVSFLAVAAVCSSAGLRSCSCERRFRQRRGAHRPLRQLHRHRRGSDREPDEPDHYFGFTDSSVWYSWTAPTSGQFFVDVSGSFAVVAIYTGSDLATLTPVTVAFNSTAFTAVSGETYQIAVSKASGFAAGAFTINLDEAGSISGNVTDDSAGALDGICVRALDADRNQWLLQTLTRTATIRCRFPRATSRSSSVAAAPTTSFPSTTTTNRTFLPPIRSRWSPVSIPPAKTLSLLRAPRSRAPSPMHHQVQSNLSASM